MEPIFKKCLLAITKINEELLPKYGEVYNQFTKKAASFISEHEELNETRRQTKSAVQTLKEACKIENIHVKNSLENLSSLDKTIDDRSRYLNDLLTDIKRKHIKKSKDFAQKNHTFLVEMKEGRTPAQELLVQIVNLGKDIQKSLANDMINYQKEIESFIKKAINMVCYDAKREYDNIMKLDSGTFVSVRIKPWVDIPDAFLRTSGAFVHDNYQVK